MSLDMLWLCGLFLTASFCITASSQGPIIQVQAVIKGQASLPCDITPPIKNDSVLLVIWYKNGETAVYSYDSRRKIDEKKGHWKDTKLMEGRAYFRTLTEPATLSLDDITEEDEGLYRCRVDFKKSPTRNTKVQLSVIVPPGKPKIYEKGKELLSISGPHEEGSSLTLKCIVSGGKPKPSVIWWRGEAMVDSSDSETAYPDVKDNQLTISRLNRSDLGAVYTCQASNNNISQPLSASVSIEMHFKPLSASILSSRQPLSVDRKYEIVCQSVESRPPAKISWWKGNKRLDTSVEEISPDGNFTTSTLTFTPTLSDDGKSLTCRAENAHVRAGFEEDSWKLIIHYAPMLDLVLGAKLNPEDIEEGDDVYFKCRIRANPPAYKVTWKHDGRSIMHNPKSGIILGNEDMALQGVRRQQAGNYSCIASNVEGDSESNIYQLKIMFKPTCKPEQKRVYGVARHEDAKVICEVDSYPPPDSFRWSFNNTAETIEVPQSRYSSGEKRRSLSILTYKPVSEMDYGSVMCWATNTAGSQKEPCVFHIVAAGKPDPPYNCSLSNQTANSLEVECLEGFDGGLTQIFILEVFDLQTNTLEANLSSPSRCVFLVNDLMPGKLLRIRIFATNGKGRSESIYLEGFTLNTAEKQTGMPANFELTPVLGAVLLLSVIILIVTLVGIALLRARTTHSSRIPITRPSDLALVKDKTNVPLRSNIQNLYDDKNPDVIPCNNKDSDYQLVNGSNCDVGSKQSTLSNKFNLNSSGNITPNKQTDLYDSFKRMPPLGIQNKDITYAELSLPKSNSQENHGLNHIPNKDELTIYAQIDHSSWAVPYSDKGSPPPLLFSPGSVTTLPSLHREIVTVRTPLMANQQESCV
nr:PREDICTED: nephrin [Bemisia tabaci]XP_018907739.1 PREDICTED: nephrin [Bemisia tabaci]